MEPADRRISPAGPPSVSVVMPALDAAATIDEQLAALLDQTYRGWYEVIVVDDGSSDGTQSRVRAWRGSSPAITLVDVPGCRGIGRARNRGLAVARGEILLCCDADDIVSPAWIESLVDTLGRGYDLVGGPLDHVTLNTPRPCRWLEPTSQASLNNAFGLAPFVVGANFGGWTRVIHALGGWDPRYATGGEDIALSWRALERGYAIGFAPGAVVAYRHRARLAAVVRQGFARGRQVPRLLGDHRHSRLGTPRLRRGGLRTALTLVGAAPRALVDARARGPWMHLASTAAGVLYGMLERVCRTRSDSPESLDVPGRSV